MTAIELEMKMSRHSDEWNFRFIEEVEKRPDLWQPGAKGYRGKLTSYMAWTEIAFKFGMDVPSSRMKWKMLRQRFRRDMRKNINTWICYPKMLFLCEGREEDASNSQSNLEDDSLGNVDDESYENLNEDLDDEIVDDIPVVKTEPEVSIIKAEQDHFEEDAFNKEDLDKYVDADYCFLMSIIPIVKSRPITDKNKLKFKIRQLIYDEAFSKEEIRNIKKE